MSLFDHSIVDLNELLHKKEIKVSELADQSFKRIEEVDGKIEAFLTVDEENARAKAKKLDELQGTEAAQNPLFGIPAGLKDNIVTKNVRTTCASKMLENFDPIYSATAVTKLDGANALMIGKLNLDEFAMGSTTETSYFKKTKNPWNLDKVPGGSSGGPAAAVAAGEVLFALGTDTGGSIRQPAAFCGVVGMKPTYGRVSRYGVVAFASSLDHVGPITRSVADNALVLEAISGLDPSDSTTADRSVPNFSSVLTGDIKGLKIGVPKEYLGEGVSEASRESVLAALKVLESLGATWEEVSLPHSKYSAATYHLLSSAEASANLARFDGVRYGYSTPNPKNLLDLYKKTRSEGFGDEVKRRIILGTHALSADFYDVYYKKAQQVRTLIMQDFAKVFGRYDVIIGPTTASSAMNIGEVISDQEMETNDLLTTSINLAGLPAISIPCGFSEGMPLGLQIIGKHFDEESVYKAAYAFEQSTNFHTQKPQL